MLHTDPNPDEPMKLEMAEQYYTERDFYDQIEKYWTEMYA